MKIFCIWFRICVSVLVPLMVATAAVAAPPAQKFFPLNREVSQQQIKSSAKFFPINKGKPMKLIFSSAKKNIIYAKDKNAHSSEKVSRQPEKLSEGNASQLLSIYEPVD
ncbi:MAG: hypothetical protein ACK502_02705 [Alphaproteobacteria bacterium]